MTTMNETSPTPPESVPSTEQVGRLVREHPVAVLLGAVGIGCAMGLLARELLSPPPPPRHRALQILEDIQSRLAELTEPARDDVTGLAEDGADAVRRGMHTLAGLRLGRRLRHWFE